MSDRIEKINILARDVMRLSRNTLVVNLRFMDKAISMLEVVPDYSIPSALVNGKKIFYNPTYILKTYSKTKEETSRLYLHMILHCVYQHFWINTLVDQNLWDLACDIAVENTINDLELMSVNVEKSEEQQKVVNRLKKRVKYITADMLYRYFLEEQMSEKEKKKLLNLFSGDSHLNWYLMPDDGYFIVDTMTVKETPTGSKNGIRNDTHPLFDEKGNNTHEEWKSVAKQMKMDLETFSKEQGRDSGGLIQNLLSVNRETYNYESFLRKFAVLCENMRINDDEFDYIFYTYGLQTYGKMPLIEPLEYKDTKRIKEFVIAIDTSGSTSGELVQKFITKTYNILKQQETFSTKFNLHIIQCDAEIQENVKITSQEEFDTYIKGMKIHGLGGTDFRPVFSYVDNLIRDKEFRNLKGMIYFTDGFGTFPTKQPEYDVAFVYLCEGYENPEVPVWAIKLVLDAEKIKGEDNEY